MRLNKKLKLGFLVAVLSTFALPVQLVLAAEDDGQRAPPTARTSGTLGQQVMRAITSIQEMMQPEDEDDEPDLVGAKEALDELYERRFERMNDFEKSTTLSFYTNYYLNIEDYVEAIRIFKETLTIETLREDVRLRTLRSLGQLQAAEENWQESIDYYQQWRDISLEEDDVVFRGLSYAHYQLEEFAEALPHWLSYMDFVMTEGEELGRDDYAYLNGIYFTLEDFVSALELTKTMIMLFDDRTDWQNLSAIYSSVDDEERRIQSLNLYYLRGFLDDESRFLNLGQSLAGIDAPYSGGKLIQQGMDSNIVEQNGGNMKTLTQMHLIASEYESALPSALQAAELDETGDGFDTVGYIHYVLHDYESAAESFQSAVDKGSLSNRSDTLMFLSRARLELRDFDAALEAATDAADAGDEGERKSAQDFIRVVEGRRSFYNTISDRKEDAIDFYQSYPALQ